MVATHTTHVDATIEHLTVAERAARGKAARAQVPPRQPRRVGPRAGSP